MNNLTGEIPGELENPAYQQNFSDNPGLCKENPLLNLHSCISKSFDLEKLPTRFIVVIHIVARIVSIAAVFLASIVLRDCQKFEAEVEILGKIIHSNIVKLLCCISGDVSKLLVYEFMENESLDQWIHCWLGLDYWVLDWPMRLKIAVGAAQALCYMRHGCSLHRNVKSSNILLDSGFNTQIADFGLERVLVKVGKAETMSDVAGSFGYIVPVGGCCFLEVLGLEIQCTEKDKLVRGTTTLKKAT